LKLVTLDPGNEEANRCLMCSSASRHDLVEVIERYRSYVVTVDRGDGDASAAMKQLLDRTIAVASREGDASTEPSTRWISEINRQHHVAAAPQPTRLLSIETATTLAVIPFVDLSPGAVSKVALADGLTDALEAHSDFNQHVIVDGYARRSEQAIHASNLHSAIRSATTMRIAGAALIAASLCGLYYSS